MQPWEYMTWVAVRAAGNQGLKIQLRNDEPVPDWEDGPTIHTALVAAGAEGWELVSHLVRRYAREQGQRRGTVEVVEHQVSLVEAYVFRRPAA